MRRVLVSTILTTTTLITCLGLTSSNVQAKDIERNESKVMIKQPVLHDVEGIDTKFNLRIECNKGRLTIITDKGKIHYRNVFDLVEKYPDSKYYAIQDKFFMTEADFRIEIVYPINGYKR